MEVTPVQRGMRNITDLARDMVTNVNFFVVQQHTVYGFDGSLSSLSGLIVNKSISLGAALLISSNLAR